MTMPDITPLEVVEPSRKRFDRQVVLAVFIAAALIIPRSVWVAVVHAEGNDDSYHLTRGLAFWTGKTFELDLSLNDPPLGEAIVSLPLLAANFATGNTLTDSNLYEHPLGRDLISAITTAWTAFLFLPFVALVFVWCRSLYGVRSAWLSTAILILEPTFASYMAIPMLDVLGVEVIVFVCVVAWRYFQKPSTARLIGMIVATAFAMSIKHTAILLPPIIVLMGLINWVLRPYLDRQSFADWRRALPSRIGAIVLSVPVLIGSLWAFTCFDISTPPIFGVSRFEVSEADPEEMAAVKASQDPANQGGFRKKIKQMLRLDRPWPGGLYVNAFIHGATHGKMGHSGFLFGEKRMTGWWYYFPVLYTYKTPIGIGILFLLALFSFRAYPARWDEWSLFIPALCFLVFNLTARVNIGFRHALPCYIFIIMLATRFVAAPGRWRMISAWILVVGSGLHAIAAYHPDYNSYLNYTRAKPYLDICDSNLDIGLSLKQTAQWLDEHPQPGRTVYICYFGRERGIKYLLGDRVKVLQKWEAPSGPGILFISPSRLAGQNDFYDVYKPLRSITPDAVIGHEILMFDLDKIGGKIPFQPGSPPKMVEVQPSSTK